MTEILADTGPLVAYLDRSEQHHPWAKAQFQTITRPLRTCEAVIAESLFLLSRNGIESDSLLKLLERGLIILDFQLAEEITAVQKLIHTYRNVPMSLADASLVRMSELHQESEVMTFDSDFTVYRRFRRRVIPLLRPDVVS